MVLISKNLTFQTKVETESTENPEYAEQVFILKHTLVEDLLRTEQSFIFYTE